MVTRIAGEQALVTGLRAGDQRAFAQLVDEHTPALLRVARAYVSDHPTAEDVVQETWIAVVKGISLDLSPAARLRLFVVAGVGLWWWAAWGSGVAFSPVLLGPWSS
ncbi:sigma-70 family RNA polymerase sigma factor, partial [Mycolicibacterium goodii]|uniref:RNA polymerase sigma factor n=1 Tax=Mycolicibacterium goodii TaxID=134601 RepID=UPI001BDD63D1